MKLGPRLRELRRAAGLTMEELAEASGVSARAISDMEQGAQSHAAASHARRARCRAESEGDQERRRLEEDVRALRRSGTGSRPGLCEPPRVVADFTGRADELAAIRRTAADGDHGGPAPVSPRPRAGRSRQDNLRAAGHRGPPSNYPGGCLYRRPARRRPAPPSAGDIAVRLLRALDVPARAVAASDEAVRAGAGGTAETALPAGAGQCRRRGAGTTAAAGRGGPGRCW
ncbi:helix-turn-helix domain-containing protein [Streptomyces sp. KL116D]|uniref:helix-turn-helix domain-containing protein n=1 Tax=Streptomyces sp. KL116D TaxID=3045152 RepID=UPI003558DDBB